MKRTLLVPFLVSTALTSPAQLSSSTPNAAAPNLSDGYFIAEQGPHHRIWQQAVCVTNEDWSVRYQTNSYTELGTAMAYWDGTRYVPSSGQIHVTATGAEATNAQHRLALLGNIHAPGAVTITLPCGRRLVSNPLCLSYFNPETGQSVLLADVKDCQGQLLPSETEVIYSSAFSQEEGLEADIVYENRPIGVEQLVVIRRQLPSPAEWGLDPDQCVLQMITEFHNAPQPAVTQRAAGGLAEDDIDFGSARMARGAAFALGAETNRVPVTKQWLLLDNRQCLVEQVRFKDLEPLLSTLPPPASGSARLRLDSRSPFGRLVKGMALPPRRMASRASAPLALARSDLRGGGVAIDYSTLTSQTNLVIKCGTTYYVSATVNVTSNLTVEGGSVVKFTNTPAATIIATNFTMLTRPFSPALFTSKDDDTAGAKINGSSGSPSGYYGSIALDLSGAPSGQVLSNAFFRYLSNAVSGSSFTLRNVQMIKCGSGVTGTSPGTTLLNVLGYDLQTLLNTSNGGNSATQTLENVTLHLCTNLLGNTYQSTTLNATNCLLAAVGTWQCAYNNTNSSYFLSSDTGLFQSVGAGDHYLSHSSSYRGAGTTNIDAALLADLRTKTTYPPIVISNNFTVNTALSPQAARDTDTPDVGWHYQPLDYAASSKYASGCTLLLTNGVAVGTYGAGYGIGASGSGGNLISEGSPLSMNYVVRYNTVQEQATTNWSAAGGGSMLSLYGTSPARFRFTGLSLLGDTGEHIYRTAYLPSFTHCEFRGGKFTLLKDSVALTNCLWERVYVSLDDDGSSEQYYLYNNLFFGGTLYHRSYDSGAVKLAYDNLFDRTTIDVETNAYAYVFTHGYNGYVTNYTRLWPTQATDVVLTNAPVYQTSWLGKYYYATNDGMLSTLINAGSRNATNALLFHFTTTTNQAPETNSIVDIGFHYVATDSSGNPLDYDADGMPNYLEDLNGNGAVNSGETDWQSATDPGLKVWITRPRSGPGPLP